MTILSRPGVAGVRRLDWSTTILVALVLTILAQLIRVYVPLGFALAEDLGGTTGLITGGAIALAVFAAPILAAVGRIAGRGRVALVGSVVVLVAARLAVQFVHPIPSWLATVGVVGGLAALPVVVGAVRGRAGDAALLGGAIVGLSLDTAIHTAFLTWDAAWQPGQAAVAVSVGLGVFALAAAISLPAAQGFPPQLPTLRLALFGPYFALQLLFLQNAAAVASQAQLSLPEAGAVVLVGDALALALASWRPPVGPFLAGGLAMLATAGGYVLTSVTGPQAAALFVAEQCILVLLLRRALIAEPVRADTRPGRLAASCALGSAGFLVLVLLYQIHNEVPLPFPNTVVPAIAAGFVGVGAVPRRGTTPARVRRLAVTVPVVLLLVPAGVWATLPSLESVPGGGATVRIVSYNIHGAVNADGQVNPEATARAIEDLVPDVVVLQEVARGWPIFGTQDVAEWLARRLKMPYVYEPAADQQFGNAILSRLPILSTEAGPLPFGEGPQHRSYIRVRIDVGGGATLTVIATHLQEAEGSDTRARQIDQVLRVWGGDAPAVIAGDMNMQPDEADVRLFLDAGLVSVQDTVGDPCEPTAWEPNPDKPCDRPDWIFATKDLGLSEFAVVRSPASDHLPLAVTVSLRGSLGTTADPR